MNEHSSFPTLSTGRLILRKLQDTDAEAIFFLRSDERVNRFIYRPPTTNIEEAKAFINKIKAGVDGKESLYWAICLKEDPALVGTICIWNISPDRKTGELGYELSPTHQGKGIMHEAIGRVIDFAFNIAGFTNLEACTHKDNIPSTNLLLKYNFIADPERKDPDVANNVIFLLARPG